MKKQIAVALAAGATLFNGLACAQGATTAQQLERGEHIGGSPRMRYPHGAR